MDMRAQSGDFRIWPTHSQWIKNAAYLGTAALLLSAAPGATAPAHHPAGLGKVLTSKDGRQIYGFDIDQAGDDGVLATAVDAGHEHFLGSIQTFDQDTGKIVKSFAKSKGSGNSYSVDGIFAGDVALITHYVVPHGTIYAKRKYDVMNPVTANALTGSWTPPIKDIDIKDAAENQSSTTSALFAIELKNNNVPVLVISDIATNTVSKTLGLNPAVFSLGNGPNLAQFIASNEAVFALSPDGGAVGGDPPLNVLVDLKTGKITQFNGYNNGGDHAGYVNGLAVDPNTGVAATTTELNSQVEFYDLKKQKGITFAQLPCTTDTDQLNSGGRVVNDSINKLFLVVDPDYCDGSQGEAVLVYDEKGNLQETITGFTPVQDVVIDPPPRLNPSKRMGWIFGGPNGVSQLQQFFY